MGQENYNKELLVSSAEIQTLPGSVSRATVRRNKVTLAQWTERHSRKS